MAWSGGSYSADLSRAGGDAGGVVAVVTGDSPGRLGERNEGKRRNGESREQKPKESGDESHAVQTLARGTESVVAVGTSEPAGAGLMAWRAYL